MQSILGWSDIENPYRLSRASYIYIYVEFLALHFNNLSQVCKSEFTGWAIIEELSIRRRLHTFLISWWQKTHVKHWNVDLSSWYELWFAIKCIDMDVILDLFTAIQQFLEMVSIAWVNTENLFHWNTTTWNNSSTDLSLLV